MRAKKTILDKAFCLCVLAAIGVAPTQYSFEVVRKTFLSPVDPIVWLAGLLLVVQLIRSRFKAPVVPPPLFGLVFIGIAFVSWMKSHPSLATFKEIFQLLEYFVVAFAAVGSLCIERKMLKWAVYIGLGSCTGILCLALVQYFMPSVAEFRVAGTFLNRNVLGGYLSITLPVFVGLLLFDSSSIRRTWYSVALAAGACVILSGATLLALSLSILAIASFKSRTAALVAAGVIIIVGSAILPYLPRANAETAYRSIRLYDENNDVERRYTEWEAALSMTLDNPWTGVGIGRYQENIGSYYGTLSHPPGSTLEHDSQNLYLVIASSMGWIAAVAFLGLLLTAIASALRAHFRLQDPWLKGLALGLAGGIGAFMVNAIWSPLLVRGLGIPLVVLIALAASLERFDVDRPDQD